MMRSIRLLHSGNSGWRTFFREATTSFPEVLPCDHLLLEETWPSRAMSMRVLDRGHAQRARVRRMRAWQFNAALRAQLRRAVAEEAGVVIVTQHRALSIGSRGVPQPAYVATLGDAVASQLGEFGMAPSSRRRLEDLERRVFSAVDDAFFLSDWARERAEADYGGVGCAFRTARPAIADPFGGRAELEHLQSGRTGHRLLFVGNDFARKGGEELIALMRRSAGRDAELVVASRSPKPSGLPANVHWLGAVERRRVLRELMPSSDVLLLPSRRDMSPWVALEALAAGLPVVATRVGGVPELVADGETGLLIDSVSIDEISTAVEHLLGDTEFRRRLGAQGRDRFEKSHRSPGGWAGFCRSLAGGSTSVESSRPAERRSER